MNDSVQKQLKTQVDDNIQTRWRPKNIVLFPRNRPHTQEMDIHPLDVDIINGYMSEIRDLLIRIETTLEASQRSRR